MTAPAPDNEFVREVRAGLGGFGQKTLPCRYLYDDVGSALFEAITHLAEYGLTRADARILQTHAAEITGCLPGPLEVAELGSGSGIKTRPVLESLRQRQSVTYFPIDLSATALAYCVRQLEPLGAIFPIEKSYLEGMGEVASRRRAGEKLLVLFLGSTIGNFEPAAAIEFLGALRAWMRPGDGLLLGADLVKPLDRLLAVRRCRGRDGGLQSRSAGAHQPRSGWRFQPAALPPRGALPAGSATHRDAPAVARPADGADRQGWDGGGIRRGGDYPDGSVLQISRGSDRRSGARRGFPVRAPVAG